MPARPRPSSPSNNGRSSEERPASFAAAKRAAVRAVDRLDRRERLLSFTGAGLSVALGITIYFSESHRHLTKGELQPETVLIIGLVGGALLGGATYLGRRAPVGFIALFLFLLYSQTLIFGLPFLALAVWLLWHSYKVQKEQTAKLKEEREAAVAARASSRSKAAGSTRGGGSARTSSGKGGRRAKAAPTGPEASKRYTPPKPKPKPVPQPTTRKERREARAKERARADD